jgi:indolepyruvate ferredoxin oxidoreductase
MPLKNISLDDKYALDATRAYMTGIEALVRLPILQHQRDLDRGLNTAGFVSGYRGSPLGGVDQAMWKASQYLDRHHIKFVPGINEDLAATAVWGSQQVNMFPGARYDGVFAMWYGKGPGVDRSMDVIKHANAAGTSKFGGVLAVAGDDHAAKSSTMPHQSEHMFVGASMPVLNPANVQEVLDLGVYGWELSRYCGCWVALKAITENMDSAISADIDPNRIDIVIPDQFQLPADGVHIRWPDQPLDQERRLNKFKVYAAREFARVNQLNRVVIESANARLGIITTGKAYLDVMQALEDLGIDPDKASYIGLRVFKVGMSWPLEPFSTHAFATGLEEILVVEEKRSLIEDQLTGQLYNWPVERRPRVVGEFDEQGKDLLPNLGELTPAMVARAIASRIKRFYWDEIIEHRLGFYDKKERSLAKPRLMALRSPHYCSGCPHSTSTRIPEGSRALGGIGCHYMGTWEKGDRRCETFTQMGGEGVTWVGQALFTDTPHVFQNLGDGTYFHSGILAIRQAVSAGVNITYKILYNDAVAMTGGQPVDGKLSIEQMVQQLRGEGIERIALISDHPEKYQQQFPGYSGLSIDHRDRLLVIEKELRATAGTTVLIYEQTCAAEKRRRRKKGLLEDPARRIYINPAVCEGCGDCGVQSNCLSVLPLETELGRKRQIDQHACNKDYSCVNGFCPSFVSVLGGRLRKGKSGLFATDFPALPEPKLPSIDQQPWNIVVAGVGGTGVLTVTALVAMAAHIEGKGCATMNQTGLAQKYGAVVSHVRVGKHQDSINAVRIPAGDADLLIGCDLVVAAADESLAKVNSERSHAVVNSAELITADFVTDPNRQFPAASMQQTIAEEVGEDNIYFVDATAIATALLGDALASNLFLLGYCYQLGLVPVSAEAIMRAIKLNNVEVEFNSKAFVWGRRTAVDVSQVQQVAGLNKPWQRLEDLQSIIEDRSDRLRDYQNEKYVQLYQRYLRKIKMVEEQHCQPSDKSYPLTTAVARNLFKVMAYKDEYEVARLYANKDFLLQLAGQFEGDLQLQFHLAPPFLAKIDPDSGAPIKRTFPQWTLKLFVLLARLKFLRNTPWDIFSYSDERRRERQWRDDYQQLLDKVMASLTSENLSLAIELVSLPEQVCGFGHIKMANLAAAKRRREKLLKQWDGELIASTDGVDATAKCSATDGARTPD